MSVTIDWPFIASVPVAPISPMRRGLKHYGPRTFISVCSGCTDLPDEEGTETY